MNDDDWMVVLGGANGLTQCDCEMDESVRELSDLANTVNKTNKQVLIVETPYRFNVNNHNINRRIKQQNNTLKHTCDRLGFPFVRINRYLSRNHYTKHGLHLNQNGKDVLAGHIINAIQYNPLQINFLEDTTVLPQEG